MVRLYCGIVFVYLVRDDNVQCAFHSRLGREKVHEKFAAADVFALYVCDGFV